MVESKFESKYNEIIRQRLPLYKEAFLTYYGEAQRDRIEAMFQNIHLLSFLTEAQKAALLRVTKSEFLYDFENKRLEEEKKIYKALNQSYFAQRTTFVKKFIGKEIIDAYVGKSRKKLDVSSEVEVMNLIMGSNFLEYGLMDYFDSAASEVLKTGTKEDKKEILTGRKMYYALSKNMNVPDVKEVDKFLELKDVYSREYIRIVYEAFIKETEGQNLIEDQSKILVSAYKNIKSIACFFPNVKEETLIGNIFINPFNKLKEIDHIIIHELNHYYESNIMKAIPNEMCIRVGWDNCYEDKENLNNFNLMNEAINELIAKEITHLYNSNLDLNSGYDKYIELVSDFFYTYKNCILESRRTGNLELIYEEVGKDNFIELCTLVQNYNLTSQKQRLLKRDIILYKMAIVSKINHKIKKLKKGI